MNPDDLDTRVRLAAFAFLDAHVRALDAVLPFALLSHGFVFEGQRVPLLNAVRGIFKPSILPEMPLSITTSPPREGQQRPYDDVMTPEGLLYRYQGTSSDNPDNVRLRRAWQRRVPLIYFQGVVKGQYVAEWPVYIAADDPANLTFTVTIDERRFAQLDPGPEDPDTLARRRYVTRLVRQRMHQESFRFRVLRAYQTHCAICRLRHHALLEAAHILPDTHPRGEPVVPNGMALCRLHHGAFDNQFLTVTPDHLIEVRPDILQERDGPMLIHGLQEVHGHRIELPRRERDWPNREFLEERYAMFRKAG
jgi:putative restriction endonuclease